MRNVTSTVVARAAWGTAILAAAVAALPVPGAYAQAPATDATPVLAASRAALGGEKAIAAVTSFVATGRTRQVQGDNLVPIEFEIACQLPDKCVRRDEIPARESGPTSTGFNGTELIQLPVPVARQGGPGAGAAGRGGPPAADGGRAGAPPADAGRGAAPAGDAGRGAAPAGQAGPGAAPGSDAGRGGPPPGAAGRGPAPSPEALRAQRLAVVQQDFARLSLGMFAASIGSYPLTYTLAGEAEAPQGKADVVDVKGPGNFTAKLFIFRDSHLPVMLSWQGPGTPQTQGKPVETRIYYSDYRDVDGLKLPFRLRRAVGADTVEETIFDRFRINAKIDAKKFEAKK
jgi:hypothetical protein